MNPQEPEDAQERRFRHYAESKIQQETLAAVERLTTKVDSMARTINGADDDPEDHGVVGDVKTMKNWMRGTIGVDGIPSPGVLQLVSTLWGDRKMLLRLAWVAATALVTNAAVSIAQATGVLHR